MSRRNAGGSTPEQGARRRSGRSGQALVELALLAPWIFFLFITIVDAGLCTVAYIAVQNAARAGAMAPWAGPASDPCTVAIQELQSLPSSGSNASCSRSRLQESDGTYATQVTVTYRTIPLIPVPLLFSGSPVALTGAAIMPEAP